MKKIFTTLLSITFIFIFCFSSIATAHSIEIATNELKISDELKEAINNKGNSVIYCVLLELVDDIDEEQIDNSAYELTGFRENDFYNNCALYSSASFSINTNSSNNSTSSEYSFNQDLYFSTKRQLIKNHNIAKSNKLLDDYNISINQNTFIGYYASYVNHLYLTKKQIDDLSKDDRIKSITYIDESDITGQNFSYVNSRTNSSGNGYKSIRGNLAVAEGYTGSGIRVGMIEEHNPNTSDFGTSNVIKANNSITTSDIHANAIADIIFAMAPECTIYSYALGSNSDYTVVPDAANILIDTYNVNVINISYGRLGSNGTIPVYAKLLNKCITDSNVSICVASGNRPTESDNWQINIYGETPNAITVGGVIANGTNQAANNAYTFYADSLYKHDQGQINKPDICAPALGTYVAYSSYGTSFSTAFVTGTLVQMMSRNAGMKNKPETLKAAIMASGTFNAGTSKDITDTIISSKEGAGVVDAGFCLQVAGNGRRTEIVTSSNGNNTISVYVDDITKPFRVAIAWDVTYSTYTNSGTMNNPEINIRLKKNGSFIKGSYGHSYETTNSTLPDLSYYGPFTNYEIIELSPSLLSQHGAGYYDLVINRSGTISGTFTVGVAWEQY